MTLEIEHFFDPQTSTLTYLVYDTSDGDGIIIDPVLNFNLPAGTIYTDQVDSLAARARELDLKIHALLETHIHADHISGSDALKTRHFPDAVTIVSKHVLRVQQTFSDLYNFENTADDQAFDRLVSEGDDLVFGSLAFRVIETPGHTPACICYQIDKAVFCGDTIFMPDFGSGRCDFPNGSAGNLFDSVHQKLYTLPEDTVLYVGHDYQPGGRALQFSTTVSEQKAHNIHLCSKTTRDEFIRFRSERDQTLSPPALLLPCLQLNIRGGRIPAPETNGTSYLKIPLTIDGHGNK